MKQVTRFINKIEVETGNLEVARLEVEEVGDGIIDKNHLYLL